MNNITPYLIIGVVAILIVLIIVTVYRNKQRKAASWSGSIIDKQNSSAITYSYSITVRPDNGGEQFNWPVSGGLYETLSVGDKLVKRPGVTIPEITEKASSSLLQ